MHLKSLEFVSHELLGLVSGSVTYVVLRVNLLLDEVLAGKGNFLSTNISLQLNNTMPRPNLPGGYPPEHEECQKCRGGQQRQRHHRKRRISRYYSNVSLFARTVISGIISSYVRQRFPPESHIFLDQPAVPLVQEITVSSARRSGTQAKSSSTTLANPPSPGNSKRQIQVLTYVRKRVVWFHPLMLGWNLYLLTPWLVRFPINRSTQFLRMPAGVEHRSRTQNSLHPS